MTIANYHINTIDFTNFNGYASARVQVKGYWSNDVITITVETGFRKEGLNVSISHSSGGRDTDEVQSDIQAERNFGEALMAAADYAEEIKGMEKEIMEFYENYKEKLRAARAAEEKRKAEVMASQKPVTEKEMREIIKEMKEEALANNHRSSRVFKCRGTESLTYQIDCVVFGRAVYKIDGRNTSVKELIALCDKITLN